MKTTTLTALSFLLLVTSTVQAQWLLGGNNHSYSERIGTNKSYSFIFETNNIERGRVTGAGLWGIGVPAPNAKLHVNSSSGQIPFRVQINEVTKFLAHSAGGVSIGANETPPSNGLYVAGDAGFGTTFPLAKLHINSAAGQYALRAQVNGLTALLAHNNLGVSVGSAAIPPPNGLSVVLGNSGFGTNTPGNYRVKIKHGIFGLNLEQESTGNHWEFLTSSTNTLFLYYNRMIRGFFDHTTGAYSSVSDERLKTNIKPMPSVLEKVNQLKPATYQFKDAPAAGITSTNKGSIPDTYGFLAQDVMQVFPHLVKHHVEKDRNLDTYSLDYSGFGIIAIKAIQELQQTVQQQQQTVQQQQQTIQQQQQENKALQQRLAKIETLLGLSTNNKFNPADLTGVSLEQNTPNPNSTTTRISYQIPATTTKAELVITNAAGQRIKQIPLNSSGSVEVDTSVLKAGTYFYSLYLDGSLFQTKKMMVSR